MKNIMLNNNSSNEQTNDSSQLDAAALRSRCTKDLSSSHKNPSLAFSASLAPVENSAVASCEPAPLSPVKSESEIGVNSSSFVVSSLASLPVQDPPPIRVNPCPSVVENSS